MTCSLETYRARIGTFQFRRYTMKPYSCRAPRTSSLGTPPGSFLVAAYFVILLSNYFILATSTSGQSWQKCYSTCNGYPQSNSGTSISSKLLSTMYPGGDVQIWDPGINFSVSARNPQAKDHSIRTITTTVFSRFPPTKLNKMAHITNGNRGQRGKGINCIY